MYCSQFVQNTKSKTFWNFVSDTNGQDQQKILQLHLRNYIMAALVLRYWNGRGLMEIPRKLLAISGKFPVRRY